VWTSPAAAAMARRGGTVARDGVGAREAQGGLKYQRARVTTGRHLRATAARPACVRPAPRTDRGSAARTARVRWRGRCGSRRPRAERASGHVDLGRRERREGSWGTAAEGRPVTRGARRRGVLAPGLNRVADSAFEFEFLQIFEYDLTKL
jgi:hypothetical protein